MHYCFPHPTCSQILSPYISSVVLGLHLQSSCLGEQQSLGGKATVVVRPAMFYLLLLTVRKTWYLLSLTSARVPTQFWIFLSSENSPQDPDKAKHLGRCSPRQVHPCFRRRARLQAGRKSKCSSPQAWLQHNARFTYGTVRNSHQTHPHSPDPHHTAIC